MMNGAGEAPSPTAEFLTRSFKRRISEWQADVQNQVPAQALAPMPKKRKVLNKSKSSKSENLRSVGRDGRDRDLLKGESSRHTIRRKSSSRDLRPNIQHTYGIREGTASRISLGRLNLESKSAMTERTVMQRASSPIFQSPDAIMRIKRQNLDRTRPSFKFLGCSGGAGKFSRAQRTVGVGMGGFLKRLSGWCSVQGCIPAQLKADIERLDPFTYLPEFVYGGHMGFAEQWSDRKLNTELDFVTDSVQTSEKLHVSTGTETEWVMHTKALLEHAFKSYESTVSATVTSTIDLEPALLPIDLGRLSAPPTTRRTPVKPRKNSISSDTESDTGHYDTTSAKVDLAIGLDKADPVVAEFLNDLEAAYRSRAPTPFRHLTSFPIIPVKVKDESGSSLAAEYETTICASAMLASWASASATATTPAASHNLNSSMMQTENLAPTEVLDEDQAEPSSPASPPLVLTFSVIGANWYYNVVYADDIRDFTCTRQVLGPFLIGQSRTLMGTFQILQFLRMACEWGVKEWVKDMCEKLGESEGVTRGLSKLLE